MMKQGISVGKKSGMPADSFWHTSLQALTQGNKVFPSCALCVRSCIAKFSVLVEVVFWMIQ